MNASHRSKIDCLGGCCFNASYWRNDSDAAESNGGDVATTSCYVFDFT